MKLIKKLRKGFTLIELVVVIAVIAILSAVSVVSYIAITNKAKQSSDEQAVRQMNTALKAAGILGAKDINELYAILEEEGMSAKNYKPLAKDTYFFWNQNKNEIVYAKYKDGKYVGIYPESYKDKEQGNDNWFSLSGTIQTVKIDKEKYNSSTKTYTLSSAEEVYTVLTDDSHKQNAENIVLSGDVDLKGADVSFDNVKTLNGGESGSTISNLSQLKSHLYSSNVNEEYRAAMFPSVKGTLVVSNITVKNSVVGSYDVGHCAAIIGAAEKGSNVTLTNVHVENCSIYSRQKGGSFIGYVDGATVTMSGCSASNVDIYTVQGESGKLFGAGGSGAVISDKASPTTLDKITLHRGPNNHEYKFDKAIEGSQVGINGSALTSGYIVNGGDDGDNYRYFNENAKFSVVFGATNTTPNTSELTYNDVLYAVTRGTLANTVKTESISLNGANYTMKGTIPVIL